jgi:asparagine synthase (glutamine-hydrolysing)
MCGIIGAFWKAQPEDHEVRLGQSLNELRHRGPNDFGTWVHNEQVGTITLGHTRLSIIDLTAAGHQPMRSLDGRFSLVFNGEIYNYCELREELRSLGHVFHTESDTEVLLTSWAEWGRNSLSKLRGMFAFVIFDKHAKTLTCVRDAFGIKPLYYQIGDSEFIFGSEISALNILIGKTKKLNLQHAYEYLVFGDYDKTDSTFFADIKQLLPGHILTVDLTRTTLNYQLERWWWPSIEERTDLSFDQAAEKLRDMFLHNVRIHMRSDVALGATLSGGIDSSAMVCAMRHLEPNLPIHTFSFIADKSEVNEEHWVDIVNAHVRAISHKVGARPEEMVLDLESMIRAQGEPFGSTSIYAQYRVFQLAKKNGITVTLDGQGADELLAGYNGYPSARIRTLLEKREILELTKFMNNWSHWPGRSKKQALLSFGSAVVPDSIRSYALELIGMNSEPPWLNAEYLKLTGIKLQQTVPIRLPEASQRRLAEALRFAISGNGLSALLRHGDRNSMHWSIESRVPFLTIDIAEYLLGLPEDYLISPSGETKRIFKAAMRGLVPDVILDRKDKIGFQTPEREWLIKLGPKIIQWIDEADLKMLINKEACFKEIQLILEGKKRFNNQVWRLINLCCWVKIFNVESSYELAMQ